MLFWRSEFDNLKKESSPTGRSLDLIAEFKRALKGRKPSTLRLYLAGAKAALKTAHVRASDTVPAVIAAIRENPPRDGSRVSPFLRFLTAVQRTDDSLAIQLWLIQLLGKRLRAQKNPSIATRRDMALLAALCTAPDRGDPRRWPLCCLKVDRGIVYLWDRRVEEPACALSLSLWCAWRERIARPEQSRLYRKSTGYSKSELLFPGPRGAMLSRVALHNALKRINNRAGEGTRAKITPHKIKCAFLAGDPTPIRSADA
jgi:hypothetical protein